MRKGLAPRGGFEPPTFRLTALKPNSLQFAGAEGNRTDSASSNKPELLHFSFSIHCLSLFYRRLAPIARHCYDTGHLRASGSQNRPVRQTACKLPAMNIGPVLALLRVIGLVLLRFLVGEPGGPFVDNSDNPCKARRLRRHLAALSLLEN